VFLLSSCIVALSCLTTTQGKVLLGIWVLLLLFQCLLHHCPLLLVISSLIFKSLCFMIISQHFLTFYAWLYLSEIGNSDRECWVHAFLPIAGHLLDEHLILCLWNAIGWPLLICKNDYIFIRILHMTSDNITSFKLTCFFSISCALQLPNGVGTILGVIQLLLYVYYSRKSREDSRLPLLVSCQWFCLQ